MTALSKQAELFGRFFISRVETFRYKSVNILAIYHFTAVNVYVSAARDTV